MLGNARLIAEQGNRFKKRTCIFGKQAPMPWDGRVDKRSGGATVNVDGKIDGHL